MIYFGTQAAVRDLPRSLVPDNFAWRCDLCGTSDYEGYADLGMVQDEIFEHVDTDHVGQEVRVIELDESDGVIKPVHVHTLTGEM